MPTDLVDVVAGVATDTRTMLLVRVAYAFGCVPSLIVMFLFCQSMGWPVLYLFPAVGLLIVVFWLASRQTNGAAQLRESEVRAVEVPRLAWPSLIILACFGYALFAALSSEWWQPGASRDVLTLSVISRAADCSWQLLLVSSLAGALQLVLIDCDRRWLGAMLLLQPLVMSDRVPLALQPFGCPSWLQTLYASAALALAAKCSVCSHGNVESRLRVSIRSEHEPHPPQARGVCISFDQLPLTAALLSVAYLALAFQLEDSKGSRVAYHVVWALLRPTYFFLFLGYALAEQRPLERLRSFMSITGVAFFGLFCPLSGTEKTFAFGSTSTCASGLEQSREGLPKAAHSVEAACFYFSMALFYYHGLHGRKWGTSSTRFAALGAAAFAVHTYAKVDKGFYHGHLSHSWSAAWRHSQWAARLYVPGAPFAILHYWVGYMSIALICVLVLADGRRQSPSFRRTVVQIDTVRCHETRATREQSLL